MCPVLNVPREDGFASALWAKASDGDLLYRSSSGGVFGLLAADALARGGVVSGAAWEEGCRELRHVVIECEEDLDSLMRSKYVQSSIGREVYEGVRDALRAGRPTLFCGTACQVAGMRSYLGALAGSDLFLGVDVICHGVPAPALWSRWTECRESAAGAPLRGVNMRSKTTGWSSYSASYEYDAEKDGAILIESAVFRDDWYMRAFLSNACLRPSCFSCPFKRRCGSDVTLGDFWGVGSAHPEVDSSGGVSAVICNSEKGVAALAAASGSLVSGPSTFEKVLAGNPALAAPARSHADWARFMAALADGMPIEEMMSRWGFGPTLGQRLASRARGVAKRLLGRA